MAGDQKGKLTKDERFILEAMTTRMEKMMDSKLESFRHELHSSKNQRQKRTRKEETKMADYEKKISSIDKEIINIIKHLDKQKKLIKHQESVSTVSELKAAEPDLAAPIQEDQANVSAPVIQKEKKPVQEVMVPIIQKVIEEEAPTKPQEDHGMNKLIVFDPSDFQRTFLSTFLISPFVWNKTRAVELSRHEMGMKHVVFEPGGKLCSLRKKNQLIEKESAAATFDFVNFSTSEDKVLHASAQQEFHYRAVLLVNPASCGSD